MCCLIIYHNYLTNNFVNFNLDFPFFIDITIDVRTTTNTICKDKDTIKTNLTCKSIKKLIKKKSYTTNLWWDIF